MTLDEGKALLAKSRDSGSQIWTKVKRWFNCRWFSMVFYYGLQKKYFEKRVNSERKRADDDLSPSRLIPLNSWPENYLFKVWGFGNEKKLTDDLRVDHEYLIKGKNRNLLKGLYFFNSSFVQTNKNRNKHLSRSIKVGNFIILFFF